MPTGGLGRCAAAILAARPAAAATLMTAETNAAAAAAAATLRHTMAHIMMALSLPLGPGAASLSGPGPTRPPGPPPL